MKKVLIGFIVLMLLTIKINVFKYNGNIGNLNCYKSKNGMHLIKTTKEKTKIIIIGLRLNPLNTENDLILYEGY